MILWERWYVRTKWLLFSLPILFAHCRKKNYRNSVRTKLPWNELILNWTERCEASVSIPIHLKHRCSACSTPQKYAIWILSSLLMGTQFVFNLHSGLFVFSQSTGLCQPANIYPFAWIDLIWNELTCPYLNWHELPWSDLNCFYFQFYICSAHHICHWNLFWVENKVENIKALYWSRVIYHVDKLPQWQHNLWPYTVRAHKFSITILWYQKKWLQGILYLFFVHNKDPPW